ncbi:MAG: hypothetical protein CSA49_01670 [Gammaproteobacteria bacterium]|nr:MAG: hypothetical protein CSA49_01670 [Gammaproteobacteria bacterium]
MATKILLPLCLLVFVISFWQRNHLGNDLLIGPQLQPIPEVQQAPSQRPISAQPFEVTVNDTLYTVKPQYEYEIYGLVVSYQFHNGDYGLHRRWGDHLNVADICVIWQDNATSEYLGDMNFWNGEFTCFFKTYSDQAWAAFNGQQLSNNHLIAEDPYIRQQIEKVSIGDQIKISGWLSSYGKDGQTIRGTSTTRDDKGNGACETIYVNDFQILSSYTSNWKILMYLSVVVMVLIIVNHFRKPFRVT